jgi:tetratricopeptide (TPR) repeat protein
VRRLIAVLGVASSLGLWACAPARPPSIPDGEDYVYPTIRAGELPADDAAELQKAWRRVLSGDVSGAERGFHRLLARRPGLASAETGLAFARLRGGRLQEAAQGFARVLEREPTFVPALVGAASVAYRQEDAEGSLAFLRRLEVVRPDDPTLRRRLPERKLQVTERRVAAAQAALARGDSEAALSEYQRALLAAPEVGAVRIEAANLLAAHGDAEAAIELLRADPMSERQVQLRLGELLEAQRHPIDAFEVYRRMLLQDPKDAEATAKALAARAAAELQGMPEEYRRIAQATRISRADLAALVAVKVTALRRVEMRQPEVAVDISGSWAREYILQALALGILDLYPNHTFQPGATARRGDLARVVGRVLDVLGAPAPAEVTITDMSATNLYHDAVVRAVGAGLMDLTAAGAFEAWRPVSGRDASDVLDALARLVGP